MTHTRRDPALQVCDRLESHAFRAIPERAEGRQARRTCLRAEVFPYHLIGDRAFYYLIGDKAVGLSPTGKTGQVSNNMSDQDAFDRILATLYDAMLNDASWPAASALIDEACGLQGHVLAVGGIPQDEALGRCSFVGLYHQGQRLTDREREYFERYLPLDERIPRFKSLPDSQLVPNTALYTAEELKTSLIYNEVLPRYNGQNCLNARLAEPDGSHIIWSLYGPITPDGWRSPQLALLSGCCPICGNLSASEKPWSKPRRCERP